MKNIAFLFLYSFYFSMCQNPSSLAPEKVEGIPSGAFWSGGIDGGAWFLIQNIDSINLTALFQIYYDTSGEVWLNKVLKLNCESNTSINWTNLREEINSFNGDQVALNRNNFQNQECFFE